MFYSLRIALQFEVFFVLLLFCHTLCVSVYADSNDNAQNQLVSAVLFKTDETINVSKSAGDDSDGDQRVIKLTKFKLSFLVGVKGGVMVAVAEANYTEQAVDGGSTEKVGVVAKYIEPSHINEWKTKTGADVSNNWKKQLAAEDVNKGGADFRVKACAVNANKDKIYVFLVNITSDQEWEFKLVEGAVEGQNGERIKWTTEEKIVLEAEEGKIQELKDMKISLDAANGFVFLTGYNKIVFVVKGKSTKDGANSENVAVFFQFEEKNAGKVKLLKIENTASRHLSFFQWKGKILKIHTNGPNHGKVMVFDTSGNKFKETGSDKPIASLGNFLKDKNNFVTVTIGESNNDVLLFTQEKELKGKKNVYLWMTDGTRVSYVGPIITGFKDISYGPVLHTNNNLFVLHQNYDIGKGDKKENEFNITLLDGQLDNINNIMTTWKDNEDTIKQFYKGDRTESNPCSTDGIVGFLHSTINVGTKKEWTDKYFNTNADIHGNGATQDGNGFKFTGDNAGAQWQPKQQNEEPYNFNDFGFTLLATVTVGSSSDTNSVLGVDLTGNTKTVGLWCTTDGNWGVSGENSETDVLSSEINCTPDERYYVALVLEDNKISAYVDGQKLPKSGGIDVTQSQKIDYFYFGADKDKAAKTNVTVTDVLLYNRPCDGNKIQQLKPKKEKKVESQHKLGDVASKLPTPDNNRTEAETESPSSTSATPTNTEKDGTETNLCLFLMSNVIVLFLLFGVFTL